MGRLVAAGSKLSVDKVIDSLAHLNALHIVDYDGNDEGFSLGTPEEQADEIGKMLARARSAASVITANSPTALASESLVRSSLSNDIPSLIDDLLDKKARLDTVNLEISSLNEESSILSLISPLNLDVDLLDGYENLTSFVGLVDDISFTQSLPPECLSFTSKNSKQKIVAVFIKSDILGKIQPILDESGFSAVTLPSGEGDPNTILTSIANNISVLMDEKEDLEKYLSTWSSNNGEILLCCLEILERDHAILTAPVRIAVSEHAFVIDGWVEMSRADEIQNSLRSCCLYVEISPFKIVAGQGGHGHSDHQHHQEMPPIAYQERNLSKPMELLTDAVGRPAYGRIDPTIFMFITYPIFFGMMLGDMAYGIVTMALGVYLISKAGINEMFKLGGQFLCYIGFATLIFGYIYAEFAGWEIFHVGHAGPAESLSILYPSAVDSSGHWLSYPIESLGLNFAFPFHRVSPTSNGGNLENLIVLAVYIGFIHVFFGLLIGFRDILLHGNGHGGIGFICALFEKGSWMILLIGGFLFAYGFLGPDYGLDSEWMLVPGTILVLGATVMLMWTLYNYHGVPFPINIGLAPIEAIGILPTVISYVRLFAVGVVGVKIAETGNNKLFDPMADLLSSGEYALVPFLFIGWLFVQIFAWGLGVFSPNIHAARLHFVEWMRQYYDSSGEAFVPFGFRKQLVEVE